MRGQHFMELLQASPELQQQMQALERVYQLPSRGIVTQYSGRVMGEEAITTLYHLADGREYAASLVAHGGFSILSDCSHRSGESRRSFGTTT